MLSKDSPDRGTQMRLGRFTLDRTTFTWLPECFYFGAISPQDPLNQRRMVAVRWLSVGASFWWLAGPKTYLLGAFWRRTYETDGECFRASHDVPTASEPEWTCKGMGQFARSQWPKELHNSEIGVTENVRLFQSHVPLANVRVRIENLGPWGRATVVPASSYCSHCTSTSTS